MRGRRATADDLEFVRQLRNSNRELMTRDTREITPEEQAAWWHTLPDLYVFEASSDAHSSGMVRVGYALYTFRNGRDWISLVVAPEFRGLGFGTEIYRYRTPVSAEILLDNWPSRRSAEKAGLRVAWMDDEKVVMERW